jgi:hypothetical protein
LNREIFFETGAMLALSIDLAAAFVFAFVWGPGAYARAYGSEIGLIVYVLMSFFPSLLFGAVVIDIRKILLYAIGSIIIGAVVAIVVIAAPSMMVGEGVALVDTTITVAIASVARYLLIGTTFIILGMIVGGFAGDRIAGQGEA